MDKGDVWYLTYTLTFPNDRDEWVKQEPFTGSPKRWVNKFLDLPEAKKTNLLKNKEISWTDHNGVWVRLQILDKQVPTKWGTKNPFQK
jgi:hypothetical protein